MQLVVSIFLLLISISYLGYKFYQNFIQKKTECNNCGFNNQKNKKV